MRKSGTIGKLDRRIDIIIPVSSMTDSRHQDLTYASWVTVWAETKAQGQGSDEDYLSNRKTAVNTVIFRIRYREQMHEGMMIAWKGHHYDINRIDEDVESGRNAYMIIEGVRRDQTVTVDGLIQSPGEVDLTNHFKLGFSQVAPNVSGLEWTITSGTLASNYTDSEKHQMCHFFRNGRKLTYGVDYNFNENALRIINGERLRNETVLFYQYTKL